jgi:ectonucleotide pyrophosphatase/phosphodiesterase family protein 5
LISDQIFDPKTNSTFQSGENMTNQWWPIKSIWTINEQRSGARSGVIGWVQDSLDISRYESYQKDRPYQEMINQILQWFTDSNEPINFGAIYFQEPAITGK